MCVSRVPQSHDLQAPCQPADCCASSALTAFPSCSVAGHPPVQTSCCPVPTCQRLSQEHYRDAAVPKQQECHPITVKKFIASVVQDNSPLFHVLALDEWENYLRDAPGAGGMGLNILSTCEDCPNLGHLNPFCASIWTVAVADLV